MSSLFLYLRLCFCFGLRFRTWIFGLCFCLQAFVKTECGVFSLEVCSNKAFQLGCFQFGILGVFKKSEERKMIHIKKTFLDSNDGRGLKQSRRHLWSFGHSPANRNAIPDWWWLTLCGIVHSSLQSAFRMLKRIQQGVNINPLEDLVIQPWNMRSFTVVIMAKISSFQFLRCFWAPLRKRRSCQLLCGLVPNWQSKPDQKQPTQRRSEEHPSTSSLLVCNAFRRQFGGRTFLLCLQALGSLVVD